jgi:hypothetical protein
MQRTCFLASMALKRSKSFMVTRLARASVRLAQEVLPHLAATSASLKSFSTVFERAPRWIPTFKSVMDKRLKLTIPRTTPLPAPSTRAYKQNKSDRQTGTTKKTQKTWAASQNHRKAFRTIEKNYGFKWYRNGMAWEPRMECEKVEERIRQKRWRVSIEAQSPPKRQKMHRERTRFWSRMSTTTTSLPWSAPELIWATRPISTNLVNKEEDYTEMQTKVRNDTGHHFSRLLMKNDAVNESQGSASNNNSTFQR